MRATMAICFAAAAVAGGEARAQSFPPDGDYRAFECGDAVMTDLFQDQAGALDERDIVGEPTGPAGLVALDGDYLYLRIRLDQDPAPGGAARPFSWGVEVDLDGDSSNYELLLLVDGVAGEVGIFENTQATPNDDPTDPADEPAVASYPFATHARSVVAGGSSFGGDDDFFLDFAAPWADLEPLGLTPTTPMAVWVASSSSANALDGDFACHDGADGVPRLSDIVSNPTVADPNADSDGDGVTDADELDAGTDPNDPNDFPQGSGNTELVGGGGCRAAPGNGAAWLACLALIALAWRRRRPASR